MANTGGTVMRNWIRNLLVIQLTPLISAERKSKKGGRGAIRTKSLLGFEKLGEIRMSRNYISTGANLLILPINQYKWKIFVSLLIMNRIQRYFY